MPYLAMTAAEFQSNLPRPEKLAWMACHFSPYGTGLTNLPQELPLNSLLILNDRTPIHSHDPQRIFDQLRQSVELFHCRGLLLDLQRPNCMETATVAEKLLALPCPVIVSECYAKPLDCPVFLPPVPLDRTIAEYISPWQGREVWLEAALDSLQITVTEDGCTRSPVGASVIREHAHSDNELFCHYTVSVSHDRAVFSLCRTKDDLNNLLSAAKTQGIANFVGLYQELGKDDCFTAECGRFSRG